MKRIISYILLLATILLISAGSFSIKADDEKQIDRIIGQATLEDDFADDHITVVIDKEHSEINIH